MRYFSRFRLVTICIIISTAVLLSFCVQKNLDLKSSSADGKKQEQYDRYDEGELKGFIKLPEEQFSQEIEKPFFVKEVRGICLHGHYDEERVPLAGVIIELRGPGSEMRIFGTVSDDDGKFQFNKLPAGNYRFKTSLFAFQPVIGRVIVSNSADCSNIEIRLIVDN